VGEGVGLGVGVCDAPTLESAELVVEDSAVVVPSLAWPRASPKIRNRKPATDQMMMAIFFLLTIYPREHTLVAATDGRTPSDVAKPQAPRVRDQQREGR
jgi:hypothetical protein